MSNDEVTRKKGKPIPTAGYVEETIHCFWGLSICHGSVKQLDSYDDANFYFIADTDASIRDEYIVKFYNYVESKNLDLLDGLNLYLSRITDFQSTIGNSSPILVPEVLNPLNVSRSYAVLGDCSLVDDKLPEPRLVAARVFRWIKGPTMNSAGCDARLLCSLGRSLALLTLSAEGFDHPAFHRVHAWDLRNFEHVLHFSNYIDDEEVKATVAAARESFQREVLSRSLRLRSSIIMGDCNDANVVLSDDRTTVRGIIDFGDTVHTWTINELAICMAYALLTPYGRENPVQCMTVLLGGYISVFPLHSEEIDCLYYLICARLGISISIGAYSIAQDPENEYLKLHAQPARNMLFRLIKDIDAVKLRDSFQRVSDNVTADSATPGTTGSANATIVSEICNLSIFSLQT